MQEYKVGQLPTIYYIPDFISLEEQEALTSNINNHKGSPWNEVSHRRVMNLGGIVTPKGLIAAPLPSWLQNIIQKVSSLGLWGSDSANHVLINEYSPGDGILAHTDGPAYSPVAAILSLNASTVIRFKKSMLHDSSPQEKTQQDSTCALLLLPQSLIVFTDDAYSDYLHGIDSVKEDTMDENVINLAACGLHVGDTIKREGVRLSLTIRRVDKTHSGIKIKL